MMPEREKKNAYVLTSLDKALKVLDILSVKDEASLAELCKISTLDKSSLFKILFTLERRAYVFKTADAKYRLGVKFANYGNLVSQRQSTADIAQPYLRALRDKFGQTVYLGVLNANGRVIVMQMEAGTASDSIATRLGYEMDAYTNAMGKVLLAHLSPTMQHEIVDNLHFRAHTATTITTAEALYPVLETTRAQGYAEDCGEQYPGHGATAAPIFDASKRCIASLSLVCSTERQERNRLEMRDSVIETALSISAQLGY